MMKPTAISKLKILLVAGVVGLLGCSERKQPTQAAPERAHGVAITEVRKMTIPDFVEATGTVRSAATVQLASQVMGTIRRVNVHEGDQVQRGEVLVWIDQAQQQAAYSSAKASLQVSQESISAAEADYGLAQATMNRYQMLYEKKSLSRQEYDEVKTRLAAAEARRGAAHASRTQAEAGVVEAGTAMSFTRVSAPFDGVVTSKLAEPGAMATPGVPLLVVEDPRRFRLEAQVDESKIVAVKLGETVQVTIDSLGDQPIEGKVTQIVPAADPASRAFTVKIDLPWNPQIRSGIFGRARFPRGQREGIEIPREAVLNRGQLEAVYVIGNDRVASLRFVTLGTTSGNRVEVLSGLESGDRIVAQPMDRELSGTQVEAQ
jgi:RND family efflux transporter MFP subunit